MSSALDLIFAAVGVALLGGLGSVIRFWLSRWDDYLPWGILTANTVASLIAGLALGTANQTAEFWIVAGLAGGLSTFSSFAAQTGWLLWKSTRLSALANVLLNVVFPILAVLLGLTVGATLLN